MLYLITLGSGADRAVILNDETICTWDEGCDRVGVLDALEQTAVGLSSALNLPLKRLSLPVPPMDDWNWQDVIETLPADAPPEIRFAIHLDGGLVRSVHCADTRGLHCTFHVYYAEANYLDDSDLTWIDQGDGQKAPAYVQRLELTPATIRLADVFGSTEEVS